MAMILDNPGEQPHQTRYRDPERLKSLGYTDLIVYPTTGLSGLLGPESVEAGDMRRWVQQQYDSVRKTVSGADSSGLGAWLTYDAPALAGELVGSAMTCINQRPVALCPGSDELLDMSGQCLESMLNLIDGVEGIVLRLGDSDAQKVPYLIGNDVYSPHCSRCSGIGRADRVARFINYFYELVVLKLGKRLMIRAWNVRPGGMHDNEDVCRRIVSQIPQDQRLILSFKFTHTDFWRYQRWNPPSLECGDRPIVYELQCQREFEAKGAVPNYQAPLWRDGLKELDGAEGLAGISERVNMVGLLAWVRGGGWRGPYIANETETWVEPNIAAVPALAANPQAGVDEMAESWVTHQLGVQTPDSVAAIKQVLSHSTQTILESFYIGPYALNHHTPWYPAAHFIQDDQINAEAAWQIVQQVDESGLDALITEKQSAEQRLINDRHVLDLAASNADREVLKAMMSSLEYAESLVRTLRTLLTGLVAYRRHLRKPADAVLVQTALTNLNQCQRCWVEHTQHHARRETASAFDSDNLWSFTQSLIDRLTENSK